MQTTQRGTRLAKTLLMLAGAGLMGPAGLAQTETSPDAAAPPVPEIIAQAVGRAIGQREYREDLRFESTITSTVEHLDGDGTIEKTEIETYRRYPIEGVFFEELVSKDGNPLSEKEAREEQERKADFVRDVQKKIEKGEDPRPEEEQVEFDREFVERYTFALMGEETVRGEECWIVYFEPREGKLPVRRRIDHALNNSTGRLWVSREDFGLVRVEFEMARPVRFWGGVLGTLRNTVGRIEFQRVEENVWLPSTLDIRLDLRIFFSNIRRRIVREIDNYVEIDRNATRGEPL